MPEKEDFYSHLNMKDITDANCRHAKRDYKDFKIKNLGICHDLYVQSDKLLLDDVFENLCLTYMNLIPSFFLLHHDQQRKQPLKRPK